MYQVILIVKHELPRLNEQIRELQAQVERLTGENTNLQAQLTQMQAQLTASADNLAAVRTTNAAMAKEKEECEKKLAELQAQLTGLQNDAATGDTTSQEQITQITALNTQIGALQEQVERLTGERDNLQAQLTQMQAQLTASADNLAAVRTTNAAMAKEKEECEKKLAELQAQLTGLQNDAATGDTTSQARITALNEQIEELQAQVERLTGENTNLQAQLTQMQAQLTASADNLAAVRTTNAAMAKEKEECEKKLADLQAQVAALQNAVDTGANASQAQITQITALNTQIGALQEQVERLTGERAENKPESPMLNTGGVTQEYLDKFHSIMKTRGFSLFRYPITKIEKIPLPDISEIIKEYINKTIIPSKHSDIAFFVYLNDETDVKLIDSTPINPLLSDIYIDPETIIIGKEITNETVLSDMYKGSRWIVCPNTVTDNKIWVQININNKFARTIKTYDAFIELMTYQQRIVHGTNNNTDWEYFYMEMQKNDYDAFDTKYKSIISKPSFIIDANKYKPTEYIHQLLLKSGSITNDTWKQRIRTKPLNKNLVGQAGQNRGRFLFGGDISGGACGIKKYITCFFGSYLYFISVVVNVSNIYRFSI